MKAYWYVQRHDDDGVLGKKRRCFNEHKARDLALWYSRTVAGQFVVTRGSKRVAAYRSGEVQ